MTGESYHVNIYLIASTRVTLIQEAQILQRGDARGRSSLVLGELQVRRVLHLAGRLQVQRRAHHDLHDVQPHRRLLRAPRGLAQVPLRLLLRLRCQTNDSVVKGAFLVRGQEALPAFDVAPDYESYEFKKLDPKKQGGQVPLWIPCGAWDEPIDGRWQEAYEWADGKVFK